jgi:hypothetical protein
MLLCSLLSKWNESTGKENWKKEATLCYEKGTESKKRKTPVRIIIP